MSDTAVLHYFKGRGRAETIRLMLAACDVQFKHGPFLTKPEVIDKLRADGLLMFNQVPLLQIDGLNLVQSMACVRYLAKKYNKGGGNSAETARVEMLTEGARDCLSPLLGKKFGPDDKFAATALNTANRYMPVFERELPKSNDYFVGSTLTQADVCIFECLLLIDEECPQAFDKCPKLKSYMNRLKNEPCFASYLASDKRFPPNHEQYVKEVKETLRW